MIIESRIQSCAIAPTIGSDNCAIVQANGVSSRVASEFCASLATTAAWHLSVCETNSGNVTYRDHMCNCYSWLQLVSHHWHLRAPNCVRTLASIFLLLFQQTLSYNLTTYCLVCVQEVDDVYVSTGEYQHMRTAPRKCRCLQLGT